MPVLQPLAEIAPILKIPAAAPSRLWLPAVANQGIAGPPCSARHIPVLWQTVGSARPVERLHDLRLVFASRAPERKPWWGLAALISWGIALFEYLIQVPANRIGNTEMNRWPAQDPAGSHHLTVLCPFCRLLRINHRSLTTVAALCIPGAVYFVFRS